MGLSKPDTTPSLPADLPAGALAPHDASTLGLEPIPIDQHDRYQLPLPGESLEAGRHPWTRSSTLKGRTQNGAALKDYDIRMIAKGMAMSPDLVALAAATPLGSRGAFQTFREIAEQARTRAGARAAANFGSALHAFTEQVDLGEPLADVLERVPVAMRPDVQAYADALERYGLTPVPELVERVVVNENLQTGLAHDGSENTRKDAAAGVAARFDRMYRWTDPTDGREYLVSGDLKTGKNAVAYGAAETCVQEAVAVRATAMWNEDTNTYEDMPLVALGPVGDKAPAGVRYLRQDFGVLVHVPIGTGTASVEWLDLEYGWRVAQLGVELMLADKGKDHCHRPFTPVGQGDVFAAIAAQDAAPGMELEAEQAFATPRKLLDGVTEEQAQAKIDELAAEATKAVEQADALKRPKQVEDTAAVLPEPQPAPPGTARDGSPLQSLAAKGERGCSVCRRKGHRAGSAKCWGPTDPDTGDYGATSDPKLDPLVHQVPAGVIACGPDGAVTELTPGDAATVQAFADQLQKMADTDKARKGCPHAGGFTRTTDPETSTKEIWVCAACGQETPQAEQARRAREAMNAGYPKEPTEQEMADQVRQAVLDTDAPEEAKADALAALEAQEREDAQPLASAEETHWGEPQEPTFLERIRAAETREELSTIRREAIAAGVPKDELAEITSAGLDVLRRL